MNDRDGVRVPRPYLILVLYAVFCGCSLLAKVPTLEFRVAETADEGDPDRDQTSQAPFVYRAPNGDSVATRTMRSPRLAVPLDRIARVRIVEIMDADKTGISAYQVWLSVDPETHKLASAFRRSAEEQEVAVMLDGRVVGLDPPNVLWTVELPGGVFGSVNEAREAYRSSQATIELELLSPSEADHIRDRARKREHRDLWELRCDPIVRAELERERPELYRELEAHPDLFEGIDCSSPPPLSEETPPPGEPGGPI